jgi:hypothetical protein
MKKLVMSVIIGLGLVIGFGFMNNANACDDCSNEEIYMTQEEFNIFNSYVWDELYLESCVNYCEECDIEYYEHCSCECRKECEEEGYEFTPEDEEYCWDYDYQLFIEDNYDMIMDLADEILEMIQQSYMDSMTDYELYEF